ncbi:Methyltransferase type 11 [Corchorus capsularis]|uniref:Methyltransferase type 11 n=1 Tax=Corchorus capsularis TaxID=210143 RepID=A0A1R3GJ85_COCAP|nr:Methyltransferase type 11 [Corchorus capsularis]
MANLFINQAKQYAEGRPNYPPELFHSIASKTPEHHLVWDVGTGNGQAARSLGEIYKNVIATDTSPTQLEFAAKLPNIRYQQTSPVMSMAELEEKVGPESSVDLVTIAQAMHWFDLPVFYKQVKWVLKKPHGVIAAWCYTTPEVSDSIDKIFQKYYQNPYWDPQRKLVDDKYASIDFPFEPVNGAESTGPFEFEFAIERLMDLEDYFTYLRSWSAYEKAKQKGVELLSDDVVEDFKRAWSEDGNNGQKLVKYPVYLRIGKVGL